jgi:3-oxoacyl-[acyl-carrier-protein] synthase-3
MEANAIEKGLLVTADPYSKVIDEADRNTALLFGDAAAATLLSRNPTFVAGPFDFGTRGEDSDALHVDPSRKLRMNGRAVFNFSAQEVPRSIARTLEARKLTIQDVDLIILHQGSRFIVETIARRLGVGNKAPFYSGEFGNTVSSSIPIGLATLPVASMKRILVSGFGVGLSWATTILERTHRAC